MKQIRIGSRFVGNNLEPYIIAEIGVNHEGSIALAKRLVEEAAEGGAHAAKFQSYKAEKIASRHSPAYWDLSQEPTTSQYKLFKKYDTFGPKEYTDLARHCEQVGVDFMSTPFDLEAVDYLKPLVPAFKIASADITNVPLLRKVARTRKPLLLSTGAATLPEIEYAVELVRAEGCSEVALLHCVLNYPTPVEHAQLGMISVLRRVFPDYVIGYSDHVVPDESISALEAAMLLGSCILEKHFTHDKNLPGNDHYHAMDKNDLVRFVKKVEKYCIMVSSEGKDLSFEQAARQQARRSIVAARKIEAGEIVDESNLTVKRPGHGISPVFWDEVVGKKALKAIEDDELIGWNMIG